ncbi:hypothetical protein Emag_007873 [Eimeria magna]
MVYDRAMREIFPCHCLRRYVEIPPHLCPHTYGPRHPRLPCGRFVDYYHLHTLFPSGRSPAYEPSGSLAPSVSSSVAREEERAQGSPDDEADSPPPVVTSPSTPTTSVGGSLPGGSSPVDAPEALEPLERPRRRRRIGPPSLPSPTPPDSPEEVQSPPAPANNESVEGIADSLEGVVPSSSH